MKKSFVFIQREIVLPVIKKLIFPFQVSESVLSCRMGIKSLFLSLVFLASCSGFRPFNSEEALQIAINKPEQVVIGKDSWKDPADCSARAFLNKTPGGLLFTVEVFDDSVKTGNTESYLNDGLELYFDFRPPRLREINSYQRGVFQAVILPEPGKKQIAPIEWFPKGHNIDIPGTRAFTELRDSGYIVQVSIPYSGLKRNHYWPRNAFYMDVAINDADTGRRESQIMWAGKRDNWNNPHNFRKVSFEKNITESKNPPNILLIIVSQLSLNTPGAYGNSRIYTPNMDALAKYGVRFLKSYASSPVSSPARSSLLTGRMPYSSGVQYNYSEITPGIKNIGEALQDQGYDTYWAGKWHLPDLYPHTDTNKIEGFRLIDFIDEEELTMSGEQTDEPLAKQVSKFLKSRRNQPFFLGVAFQNPHDIGFLTQKPDAYPFPPNINSCPSLPINYSTDPSEPEFLDTIRNFRNNENLSSLTTNFTDKDWRNYLYHYYRMTEKADREIGKIIHTLETEGLDQNTLIILTSDYGEGSGAHQWAGGFSLYEESVKVPLIITWFGNTPKNKSYTDPLVSGIDLYPTLLDYAGGEIPGNIEGKSLRPLIINPDTSWRKYLTAELNLSQTDSMKQGRMITDGRYKLICFSQGKRNEQLFDLFSDPGETRNLASHPAYKRKKEELKKILEERIQNGRDNFSLKNP